MCLGITHIKLLDLMIKFDDICKVNNIRYTLHGGSLLGAIREQGFIPWDDDIDIAMTREEFKKLQIILKHNDKYYIYGEIKKQFRIKGDNSLWVDIFICDYIGQGISRRLKLITLTILDVMNRDKNSMKLSNLEKYGKVKQFAFKMMYFVGKIIPRKVKVKIYNNIAENKFLGNKTMMHRSNDQYKGRKEEFPSKWMENYHLTVFESVKLSIINNYHAILVKSYGEDYMTPIRDDLNKKVHDIVRSSRNGGIKL